MFKITAIYLVVVVITIACFLMNGPMRPGLPIDTTLVERIAYIDSHRVIWSLSWFIWMLSALGLLLFCGIFAAELSRNLAQTFGFTLIAIGIAPDLIAETLYAFIIPHLISIQQSIETISLFETIAMYLTGFLGNGLYNLGGLVLTLNAIYQQRLPRWIGVWGITSWLLGLLLSVSIALQWMQLAQFFTATSMVLSTMWMLIVAHKVVR